MALRSTLHRKTHQCRLQLSLRKFDVVHMNLFGKKSLPVINGYNQLLVIVDRLTGWMELVQWKSKRTEEIKLEVQDEWVCRYGYPSTIDGVNERCFIGEEISSFGSELDIRYESSAAYDKRQDGQVERSNRCIVA